MNRKTIEWGCRCKAVKSLEQGRKLYETQDDANKADDVRRAIAKAKGQ